MLTKPICLRKKNNSDIKNKLNANSNRKPTSINNKITFSYFFVIIFIITYILNSLTHLTSDDFVYSFIYKTPNRIASFSNIIESQYIHYHKWGGRSITHFIAQSLLFLKHSVFTNILNSIAFTTLIYLMYKHITKKQKRDTLLLIIIFSLIWFLQPVFGETVLWITGSSNYLWGTVLILAFLLPYRYYEQKQTKTPIYIHVTYSIIMLFCGIIVGWTNENMAAAMIVMVILFIYSYKKELKKIPMWMFFGLIGSIVGYIVMIIAPGNMTRASEAPSLSIFLIIYRILTHTQHFIIYLGGLNIGIIVLYLIYKKYYSNKIDLKSISPFLIYFTGILISIYSMVLSPSFPARAWFGTITLNIICFGMMYKKIKTKNITVIKIKTVLSIGLFIIFMASFYDAYKDTSRINEIWREREFVIKNKISEGEKTVIFKEYQAKTKFGLGDTYYALPEICNYYNIEFVLEK